MPLFLLLQNGPMIPDLSVAVVSERIEVFQARLDTLVIRLERQSSSERLFGLPVTEYPELLQIRQELNLLQRLYDLYNDVNCTTQGYFGIRWNDVNIESIRRDLLEFKTRCAARCLRVVNTLFLSAAHLVGCIL